MNIRCRFHDRKIMCSNKKSPVDLTFACFKGHVDEVKQLHRDGIEVDDDFLGKTSLMIACEIVQVLIDTKANINRVYCEKDSFGLCL